MNHLVLCLDEMVQCLASALPLLHFATVRIWTYTEWLSVTILPDGRRCTSLVYMWSWGAAWTRAWFNVWKRAKSIYRERWVRRSCQSNAVWGKTKWMVYYEHLSIPSISALRMERIDVSTIHPFSERVTHSFCLRIIFSNPNLNDNRDLIGCYIR